MSEPVPDPFDEKAIENPFWHEEHFDTFLPPKGFITDFVLYYRGREAPTIFCVWTAISVISTILKRDAHIWEGTHYPNLYVSLVAPPRRNAKGYIISQGEKILKESYGCMADTYNEMLATKKKTPILHGKATMESISEFFGAHEEHATDKDGVIHKIIKGTEVAFIIGELSTLLGKQRYNEGLIAKLTDFYDCKEEDDDVSIARGIKPMKDQYITILGGTTRGNIENSIPQEAFSTGFMSRLILVDQEEQLRCNPEPLSVIGGPKKVTLSKRLAYVAHKATGAYYFDKDALKEYYSWYRWWFTEGLPSKDGPKAEMFNRFDIHLVKLCIIIRAQRYETGTNITLRDFKAAKSILEETYRKNQYSLETVHSSPFSRAYTVVRKKLVKEGTVPRVKLVRHCSAYGISAIDLTRILYQMKDENKINIKRDTKLQEYPSKATTEEYVWTSKEDER